MKIYEANDHILIHSHNNMPVKHRHLAAHIIICLDGEITVYADGIKHHCCGILLPSGVSHFVENNGKAVLVFLYDCTTSVSNQIKHVVILSEGNCKKITTAYLYYKENFTRRNYQEFEHLCLAETDIDKKDLCITDERILSSIDFISKHLNENICCPVVARNVYLSPSRFSHLFKEQTGMSFSSFVIYKRLMYVYAAVLQGQTITVAAINAGFSSSAHFADVNRRVFGISASSFTKELSFIKIADI